MIITKIRDVILWLGMTAAFLRWVSVTLSTSLIYREVTALYNNCSLLLRKGGLFLWA